MATTRRIPIGPALKLTHGELEEKVAPQVAACPARLAPGHNLTVPSWATRENYVQTYLKGFSAVGYHWCWQCYTRAKMMVIGQTLDYPQIPRPLVPEVPWSENWFSELEEGQFNTKEAWFALATSLSGVLIAGISTYFAPQYKLALKQKEQQ